MKTLSFGHNWVFNFMLKDNTGKIFGAKKSIVNY